MILNRRWKGTPEEYFDFRTTFWKPAVQAENIRLHDTHRYACEIARRIERRMADKSQLNRRGR